MRLFASILVLVTTVAEAPPPQTPPYPPEDRSRPWGNFSPGQVGVLIATGGDGAPFSVQVGTSHYHCGASEASPQPTEPGCDMISTTNFETVVPVSQGTELQLSRDRVDPSYDDGAGWITLAASANFANHFGDPMSPAPTTTVGFHINCGSWEPGSVGSKVIFLSSYGQWGNTQNLFVINNDGTLSPYYVPNGWDMSQAAVQRDYVLAWGAHRNAPCWETHPDGSNHAVTIEDANDPSTVKFYFTPTQPAPPGSPPSPGAPPQPPAYPHCTDMLPTVATSPNLVWYCDGDASR